MKLKQLLAELHGVLAAVGEDAEVNVTGLYSARGDIESVEHTVRRVRTQQTVNGQVIKDIEENESTVTLRTDCG